MMGKEEEEKVEDLHILLKLMLNSAPQHLGFDCCKVLKSIDKPDCFCLKALALITHVALALCTRLT